MAHHNSTPQSVLDAPPVEVRWFVKHTGLTRAQRRKFQTSTGKVGTIPKAARRAATNAPYVKPKPAPVTQLTAYADWEKDLLSTGSFGTKLHEQIEAS